MRKRMTTEMATMKIDNKNGTRQPQSAKASLDIEWRHIIMTISDTNRPIVAVVCIHDVQKPLFSAGECSATYVAAPPYSPT